MTTTTTSTVTYNGDSAKLLREHCADIAKAGGTYSIREYFQPGSCWMIEVVINYPDNLEGEKE